MQPNIIFITCHDLGRYLGCYGYKTVHTPALDSLSRRGVHFANHFCTAPQCSPSRATLHTGRYAHATGMLGLAHEPFGWRLHADERHLASLLAEQGYVTALWGAQHLTSTDDVAQLGYRYFDTQDALASAPAIAAKACAFLEQQRHQEQPFYLELGFFEPHRPYDWGGAEPDTSAGVELLPYLPDTPGVRHEIAALQGAVRRLDEAIAVILESLTRSGMEENTWVIFAADHGLAMPRAKCTLYDPGLEVVLLMRWPGVGLDKGRQINALSSHVDVVPTILDALEITPSPDLHGRSFWPLLQGRPYITNEFVFAEKTFHTSYEPMRCVRTREHKLIINFEIDSRVNVPDDIRLGPTYLAMVDQLVGHRPVVELYDLVQDPGETINVVGQEETEGIEESLRHLLTAWMRDTGDPLLVGPVSSPYYERALTALLAD